MVEIPILQYERVEPVLYDDLTYKIGSIKNHFQMLREEGYETVSCQQLYQAVTGQESLPPKPIVLTFDRGLKCYYQYVPHELSSNMFSATFFISGECALKSSFTRAEYADMYMNIDELRELSQYGVELALHTFSCYDFKEISLAEIQAEVQNNVGFFDNFNLPFTKALAYSTKFSLSILHQAKSVNWILSNLGILLAFHSGNKWFSQSLKNRYSISRLSVREEDSSLGLLHQIQRKRLSRII